MRRIVLIALALASAAACADTYRWVDPATGRTVISDTPPPGKAKVLNKEKEAGDERPLPYAVRQAAENFPVVLYTAPDCTDACKQARDLLNGRGVPFTEKSLQKAEDFAELKQLVGDPFIPSIKIGRQSMRGFEAGAYNNLLDLAGYPKTAIPYGGKPAGGPSK